MDSNNQFNNILVYRIGHLGDTIVALPAFWAIRNKFPNSKISLLTNAQSSDGKFVLARNVLPSNGLFNSFFAYENPTNKFAKMKSYLKLLVQLRRQKFDCVFYLSTRNRYLSQIDRDVKFFRTAGISKIFGADYLKQNRLEVEMSKNLPKVKQEYKFLLDCLPPNIFNDVHPISYSLNLTNSENTKAHQWLQENCGNNYKQRNLVAVAPGSKWDSKTWFESRFLSVVKKLIIEKNIFPVIFGGSEDFEKGNRLLSELNCGANAAGNLNIREAAAALENCKFYLGNDTGTMHLAAVAKIPCVGIFAAIDYDGRWYPFGENNRILRHPVECQGCHTPNCFNQKKCLDLVSESEVYQACCEVLEKLDQRS